MENSSTVRRRTSRNARESTPDPNRGERISRAVEHDKAPATTTTTTSSSSSSSSASATTTMASSSAGTAKARPRSGEVDASDARYVVRGILNVGPPSPAGSISSSSSGSGHGLNSSASSTTGSHAYRAKILSKKEKSMAQAVHRSQSTSRQSASCQTNSDIFTYLRRAKRSLSAPRKREGSVDSAKLTPQMQEMKITMLENERYELSNKSDDNSEKNLLLEQNLNRFEEERRQFEKEKLKFLEEKRELDRLRLQRFERYKRELEARRLGIRPNYDIDNPNEYMVARKLVIDYKMNESLQRQQDSASEEDSEPDITVVEMTPKAAAAAAAAAATEPTVDESEKCQAEDFHDAVSIDAGAVAAEDNAIKGRDSADGQINQHQSQLNGKELLNGLEKSNGQQQQATAADGSESLPRVEFDERNPMRFVPYCRLLLHECRHIWREHKRRHPAAWHLLKRESKKCMSEWLMFMIFCGMGGIILHYIEGSYEMLNKAGVKRVKRDFIDQLWLSSHNLREDDWKSMARTRLRKFEEELQTAIESGMNTYSGHTTWNFVNAVIYCLDVSTTIGYGHISPRTTTGQIVTIVYAIIGIPIFLLLLTDFGKLFTRIIKFLWVFVRRLYYTGSCRKVRKTAPAQDVMRGLNVMYDFMRRPSMAFDPNVLREVQEQQEQRRREEIEHTESPMTPMPENLEHYEIDDEFNLPISVAITMLVSYMLCGAAIYCILETKWSFFEAFYFVFISISTIGLGDYTPTDPLYMMASIFYLIFGLALTSMCINVVQLKLSDHFRAASSKIVGLQLAEAASQGSNPQSPTELQSVHSNEDAPSALPNQQPSTAVIIAADKNSKNHPTML